MAGKQRPRRLPEASLEHDLAQLEELKTRFASGTGMQVERLLRRLAAREFPDAAALIRFHDSLLFIRAHPHGPAVLRQSEQLLGSFAQRVEHLRSAGADMSPFEPETVSGIAGTRIEDTLNYDVTRRLARRFPKHVSIDWASYDSEARLAATLSRFIPLLEEDSLVEADVPYGRWLGAARGKVTDIEWLLRRFEQLPLSQKQRAELFESLQLPIRWELDHLRATRTLGRRTSRAIFYHHGPLIQRKEVSLEKELSSPPLPVERLSRRQGEAIIDLVREALAVRYRELWGTTRGDPTSVLRAAVGRGVEIFLWGLPPELRLPLRAYWAGFTLKNGVPINYIEAIGLFEWVEIGFNTFYAYRDGETAWIFAKVLRLLRQLLNVSCISVYPYQIGLGNEEAIQSGAFWFYRKLGFRPGCPDLLKLTGREERKIAANPQYRTPARILRRLATGHIFYELPDAQRGAWDSFSMRKIGLAVNRLMGERFGGDAGKFRAA
ncbi:MAG TPA: hypothetical protein VGQ71_01390, partial [Terriglobales bacterium]|nr:hypothetical protein [Terriglobales bacterium]